MSEQAANERITEEVTSWPGVEAGPGRRGEFAFRVGGREIGHLHGDHAAHFAFPKPVWRELREQGRISPHPVFPDREGPAAGEIDNDADIRDVIELLRLNYERAVARHRPSARTGSSGRGQSGMYSAERGQPSRFALTCFSIRRAGTATAPTETSIRSSGVKPYAP
jgi:hypothetical protein